MDFIDVEAGVANMGIATGTEKQAAKSSAARFTTSAGNIGLIGTTFAVHIAQLEAWRAGSPNAAEQAVISRYDEYKALWLALKTTVDSVVAGLSGVEF